MPTTKPLSSVTKSCLALIARAEEKTRQTPEERELCLAVGDLCVLLDAARAASTRAVDECQRLTRESNDRQDYIWKAIASLGPYRAQENEPLDQSIFRLRTLATLVDTWGKARLAAGSSGMPENDENDWNEGPYLNEARAINALAVEADKMATFHTSYAPSAQSAPALECHLTGRRQAAASATREVVKNLQSDRSFLLEQIVRARCGCLTLDCTQHGAYAAEDVERLESLRAGETLRLSATKSVGKKD
jgi:hypothetical protein